MTDQLRSRSNNLTLPLFIFSSNVEFNGIWLNRFLSFMWLFSLYIILGRWCCCPITSEIWLLSDKNTKKYLWVRVYPPHYTNTNCHKWVGLGLSVRY